MVIDRFQRMDEWRTDMQAPSIRPVWYSLERDLAAKVINLQNERLAALCAKHPDRFVAFASVALQYPELAAEQLEEGVKKYNLRGAGIAGHVNGDELSARKFDPFWKKAEELDCLVFMHPQGIPELDQRLAGGGYTEQRYRQSAGNHHLSIPPDFRRNARPFPRAENMRISRRWLFTVLRRAFRLWLHPVSRRVRWRKETRVGILEATLFRFDHLHSRGYAPFGCRMRSQPDHAWHRLSISLEHHHCRSSFPDTEPQRCRTPGYSGRNRRAPLEDQGLAMEP